VAHRDTQAGPNQLDERRRRFNDAEGCTWEVREVKNHDYDRRGGYCLIFESPGVVRRVRSYPANWFELPAAELHALNEQRP
jgi:hypothetical protein